MNPDNSRRKSLQVSSAAPGLADLTLSFQSSRGDALDEKRAQWFHPSRSDRFNCPAHGHAPFGD
jgi:hypothetical protein